jgi:hypothetical protein
MPTPTYTPLATVTLGSTASSVTFSSIPATYRDLIFVYNGQITSSANVMMRLNADSGTNYNHVLMRGPVDSANGTYSEFYVFWNNTQSGSRNNINLSIMDYSATDKHKTILNRTGYSRSDGGDFLTEAQALRWASTSAVTTAQIFLSTGNFAIGSTFALYAIAS